MVLRLCKRLVRTIYDFWRGKRTSGKFSGLGYVQNASREKEKTG
jgi:hypothetical protein